MTALRTYAQELAAVEAVLRPRRVEAREWARPERWKRLGLSLTSNDGYALFGRMSRSRTGVFVGGYLPSECFACAVYWDNPCVHQLGLAALWIGGHPVARCKNSFNHDLARELEGGSR